MKKIYLLLITFLAAHHVLTAQISLPYTLNFTTDDRGAFNDGIAQDGDGGTSNINGLDIEIFASGNSSTPNGDPIYWEDNSFFFSTNSGFNGLTPNANDPGDFGDGGVSSFVIKSTDGTDFSLQSFDYYDWGGSDCKVTTYKDGAAVGSIQLSFASSDQVVSQSDALLPQYFQDIDEVVITPASGYTEIYSSINKISLDQPTTLPVSLYDFNASYKATNHAVQLKWSTAEELNNDYFDLERSTDGKTFESLTKIKGAGTSNVNHHYNYLDNSLNKLLSSKLYYRLKQLDIDGRANYSKVITIQIAESLPVVKAYPNPAITTIHLVIKSEKEKQQYIDLYDSEGQLIQRKNCTLSVGSNLLDWDISTIAPGIHYFKFPGSKIPALKFIKQ